MGKASHASIVVTARTWIGTPFHLHGRVKKVGCDCLGLVMGVGLELSLRNSRGQLIYLLDQAGYHLISDGKILEQTLDDNLTQTLDLNIGNLALFSFDGNPQHLGIIGDYSSAGFSVIHSHLKKGVIEQPFDQMLSSRVKKIYQFCF